MKKIEKQKKVSIFTGSVKIDKIRNFMQEKNFTEESLHKNVIFNWKN